MKKNHGFFVFQKHDKFWSISSSIILLFLKYYIWVTIFWCFSLNEKLRKPFKSPTYFSCDEKQCVYHFSAQWHLGFQMQTWIYKPFPPTFFLETSVMTKGELEKIGSCKIIFHLTHMHIHSKPTWRYVIIFSSLKLQDQINWWGACQKSPPYKSGFIWDIHVKQYLGNHSTRE